MARAEAYSADGDLGDILGRGRSGEEGDEDGLELHLEGF